MVYDPFSKGMLLHGGRKVKQYGGAADSVTWSDDPGSNVWKDLKPKGGGPGNPWVGAMAFDPEHNAVVVFNARSRSVWAYRHRAVPAGTRVPGY
ncbi:MAG: hypothetical protein ACYTGB_13050 [Planctomycetota bacterium]|jgi:hypothetical protein